ncbi:hypothetical protein PTTG_29446 [Puccinia triticina 1-1 BBBD Race 1]|uniref:Uncharacterized protein n=1 Tax=Puccinia triticina (isolate 1-1 / race 1 (BBBD)) TaxID=630390 RepID=A0A180G430_PUCT1|nr:hypothetical protein PTTG_29446 [Puccinia triticina 1-1 BBBD Race 1]
MARSRASASPRPSRPPSRQSNRIITPVKAHGNYIRPDNDSRQSLAKRTRDDTSESDNDENDKDEEAPATQSKTPSQSRRPPKKSAPSHSSSQVVSKQTKQKSKKKKQIVDVDSSEPDADISIMDMTQDSDNDNSKVKKLSKKSRGVAVDGFDDVNDYFESPKHEDGKPDGPKNLYTCKWCAKVYKKAENTRHNLKLHQDGNLT